MIFALAKSLLSVNRRMLAGLLRVRKIEVAAQVPARIQKAKVEIVQERAEDEAKDHMECPG